MDAESNAELHSEIERLKSLLLTLGESKVSEIEKRNRMICELVRWIEEGGIDANMLFPMLKGAKALFMNRDQLMEMSKTARPIFSFENNRIFINGVDYTREWKNTDHKDPFKFAQAWVESVKGTEEEIRSEKTAGPTTLTSGDK